MRLWIVNDRDRGDRKVRRPAIGRTTLKMIAVITMLIDHIAYIFLDVSRNEELYRGMRMIGRISFPVFCFVLVQGFLTTRDVRKYLLRLSVFAVLSEIPYNLAFFHTVFYPEQQNVLFTMLIGLLVLGGMRYFEWKPLAKAGVFFAGCLAAYALRCDYMYFGVGLIALFYVLKDKKGSMLFWTALWFLADGGMEVFAVFALPFCLWYVPEKKERHLPRYFFYCFYPVHLLVLWGIWRLL